MQIDRPLPLLGDLSAHDFMRLHWQKKPLLVRAALPDGFVAPVGRARLFELARDPDVQSRLVERAGADWKLRHGPFARRALPVLDRPGWTLLVQGVDRHEEGAHELLRQFRFLPDARLDDLMISYASDQGGVGPHVDRYDVFLLQAQGRRRWRIASPNDASPLLPGLPLKILASFEPEAEFVLDPGDMLYLPPGWGHDGVAVGACLTYSIGFRAPQRDELASELLLRIADRGGREPGDVLYRDPMQAATLSPAAIPRTLAAFARRAVRARLNAPHALERALGETLSEPEPSVWFEPDEAVPPLSAPLRLDRRTRMLYDERYVYINGESIRVSGAAAASLRTLADTRALDAADLARCGVALRKRLSDWLAAGWLHAGQREVESVKRRSARP